MLREPAGWDWPIGMDVLTPFPTCKVINSELGTIYSLGNGKDEEPESLHATWS